MEVMRLLHGFSLSRLKPRIHWFLLLGLLVASLLYLQSMGSFQVGVYMDDASYVALARGLARDGVYGYTNVPGEIDQTRYPFGYPLVLSPLAKLFPSNLEVLSLVSLVITLVNGVLLYIWSTHFGWGNSSVLRVFIPLLYLFSPLISGHAVMVMSEAVFLFWVLLVLYLIVTIAQSGNFSTVRPLLLSGVVFMAATTRTLGYLLVPVILLTLVVTRKYRELAIFCIAILAIALIVSMFLPVSWQDFGLSSEYGRQFREENQYERIISGDGIVVRVISLLWSYLSEGIYSVLIPIGGVGPATRAILGRWGLSFIPTLLGLGASCIVAIGMLCSSRRTSIVLSFTVVYCGALLLWPFYMPRFLYPVLPFLSYYLFVGIEYIVGAALPAFLSIADERRDIVLRVLTVSISIVLLSASTLRSLPKDTSLNHTLNLVEGINWINGNASRDSVIMSEEPLITFIYANRSVVGMPSNSMAVLEQIDKYDVDYLLIRPMLKWTTPRILELSESAQGVLSYVHSRPDVFTLVYDNPVEKTSVYLVTLD